jgi:hypothetical protein
MEKKSTSKKVDKSQEIASCRKSISEIVIMLKEEVRLLTALLDKLTILDRNLIRGETLEVLGKSERMIHDISRSLKNTHRQEGKQEPIHQTTEIA